MSDLKRMVHKKISDEVMTPQPHTTLFFPETMHKSFQERWRKSCSIASGSNIIIFPLWIVLVHDLLASWMRIGDAVDSMCSILLNNHKRWFCKVDWCIYDFSCLIYLFCFCDIWTQVQVKTFLCSVVNVDSCILQTHHVFVNNFLLICKYYW